MKLIINAKDDLDFVAKMETLTHKNRSLPDLSLLGHLAERVWH